VPPKHIEELMIVGFTTIGSAGIEFWVDEEGGQSMSAGSF
jgi:hypothetical protein